MRWLVGSVLLSAAVLLMIAWDSFLAGCTLSGALPPTINGRYRLAAPGVYMHDFSPETAASEAKIPTIWRETDRARKPPLHRFGAVLQVEGKPKPAPADVQTPKDCRFTFACQERAQQIQAHWSIIETTGQSRNKVSGVAIYNSNSQLTSRDSMPPDSGWKSLANRAAAAQEHPQLRCYRSSPLAATFRKLQQMPQGSLLFQSTQTPVSFAVIGLNCAVFLYLKHKHYGYEDVGCSFDRVVEWQEWWRVLTSNLCHFEVFHIGFNMMSVYQLRMIEAQLGSLQFIHVTWILMLLPDAVTLSIFALLIRQGHEQYRYSCCVGYSGVVFGWMTLVTQRLSSYCPLPFGGSALCFNTHQISLPNGQHMPVNIAPFVSLGFVQLVFPRAAFHAHLGGILIGYIVAWGLHWNVLGVVSPALVTKAVVIATLVSVGSTRNGAEEMSSDQISKHSRLLKCLGGLNLCLAAAMASCFPWEACVSQLMSLGLNLLGCVKLVCASNLILNTITFSAAVDAICASVDCVFLIQSWSELRADGVDGHRLVVGLCLLVIATAVHVYNSWVTHIMYRSRVTSVSDHHDDSLYFWTNQQRIVPFGGQGRTLAEV